MGACCSRPEVAPADVQLLREEMDVMRARLDAISASANSFSVAQYNILAAYLGENRQPWFLYGIECPESRRETIMKKFYERDATGAFQNVGWPNYVEGILTAEEQAQVEAIHARNFDWSVRKPRVLQTIIDTNADIISLVELDYFDGVPCRTTRSPARARPCRPAPGRLPIRRVL